MDKPLVWLRGEIKSPPLTKDARIEAGCCCASYNKVSNFRCLTRDRCRGSVHDAMSCVFRMQLQRGV